MEEKNRLKKPLALRHSPLAVHFWMPNPHLTYIVFYYPVAIAGVIQLFRL